METQFWYPHNVVVMRQYGILFAMVNRNLCIGKHIAHEFTSGHAQRFNAVGCLPRTEGEIRKFDITFYPGDIL